MLYDIHELKWDTELLELFGIPNNMLPEVGYAINPVRDFGPWLMHAILSFPSKCDSDWNYSKITIIGPIAGVMLAAYLASLFV